MIFENGKFKLLYIVFAVLEAFLVIGTPDVDMEKITPWLLGVNFTLAISSINFTFFGYQLSKYKAIYSELTRRQWLNIALLLVLPFAPLFHYLFFPEYFGKVALWIMPILVLSSIDNAKLTLKYLNPIRFIEDKTSSKAISDYLQAISKEVIKEVNEHNAYLQNQKKFQIPTHAHHFEPVALGIESKDLWDSIGVITKLAIENNDYPVFRQALKANLRLVKESYAFKGDDQDKDRYLVTVGITTITRRRFRSVIQSAIDLDKTGMFLQSLSSELCGFLVREEVLCEPCSEMTRAIASDAVWIGTKMLEIGSVVAPIKVLNSIHRVIELGIYRLEIEPAKNSMAQIDKFNIAAYAHDIKTLGCTALHSDHPSFAYRCMETLSYLGCNAAKIRATQTIVAVFESIVQLGRVARHLKIDCFWSRCLIPVESHAEEFMGHILTWLVQDISSSGSFYMKEYAEQAYSRLRGVKCVIRPKSNSTPCFWIEELEDEGKKIPQIEYESGMWGYGGQLDYSDHSNLKEYALHGIGSASEAHIVYGEPIPISFDEEQD